MSANTPENVSAPASSPEKPLVAADVAERRDRTLLALALAALAMLYLLWFRDDAHRLFAYALFALPPLWLAVFAARGGRRARFWAGVLALLWFAHGVMIAWSEPSERGYGLTEIALAVAVVFASSAGGLRARAQKKRAARQAQR
jgi:uncharacterized membrane protein